MNDLIKTYTIDVEFPEVGPVELMKMLRTRDELHQQRSKLLSEGLEAIHRADFTLISNAERFIESSKGLVNLKHRRQKEEIGVERWWWYLDRLDIALVAISTPHHTEHGAQMIGEANVDRELDALAKMLSRGYPELMRAS